MARRWAVVLIALLLVTNSYWMYRFVDQAVTISYQSDSVARHVADKLLLGEIVEQLVRECHDERSELHMKTHFQKDHVIKEMDDVLYIDNVGLRFKERKLVEVVFPNEQRSRPSQ